MNKFAWLAGGLLFASAAEAAEVQKLPQAPGAPDLILVTGVIQPNDDVKFNQIAATASQAVVLLNSEGGSVLPALEIGRAIRLKGFATAVANDTLCASACALAWLAGTPRLVGEQAHIGFHASYVVDNGTLSESGVANALVGAYLNQIGIPQSTIVFVTSAPPAGMAWLSERKAGELGLQIASFQPLTTPSLEPGNDETSTEPYDPMKTVAAFYNALSNADGVSAAASVVPEKRGIGPFSETSIHSFFSGLSTPLKLRSVSRKGTDKVVAAYSYVRTNGAVCDGRAEVRTTYRYGKTLISRISALNGC
ncbi:hypothetical protein [Mesorhizobium sp.]|uniref:COG3904 family protein n=1 Tax=Mesorhizobium sp. TaxID=1871066 RepID=UPI0025DF4BB7|nr:hypothetical protein [Mesorhizobium sp.]